MSNQSSSTAERRWFLTLMNAGTAAIAALAAGSVARAQAKPAAPARFEHALSPLVDPARREALAVGPAPMPGTSLSPLAASWRPDTFRVTAGASFRMVLDVGAWDNSVTINTPGQSGDPASPHYRDLFPLWVKGEYVPLSYSRPAVEAATERVLTLIPGR